MVLRRAVPIVGSLLALVGPVAAPPSSAPVGITPVLASTPFGALPGQQVTHTITLAGGDGGRVTAVRVTFTTTVDLDGAAATTTRGQCQVRDPRTVVCDLRFPAAELAAASITITGMVQRDAPAGALVQNWVGVQTAGTASGTTVATVTNAYLVPEDAATPGPRLPGAATASTAHRATGTAGMVPVGVAALVGLAAALTGLILHRRLRARR